MTYANRSLGLDPLQMSLPLNLQADMANRVGFQQQSSGVSVAVVALVGVVVIGAGYLIYKSIQTETAVRTRIAEKEGSAGLLKYSAGEAGIGILSSYLRKPIRRNKKRARKTSRH